MNKTVDNLYNTLFSNLLKFSDFQIDSLHVYLGAQGQASTNEIIWEWEDGAGWHQYEFDVGKYIEQEFQKSKKHVDLSKIPAFNSPYSINIRKMSQKRVKTGTTRSIRRIELLQRDSGMLLKKVTYTGKNLFLYLLKGPIPLVKY